MTKNLVHAAMLEVDRVEWRDDPIPQCIHMTAKSKTVVANFAENLARIQTLNSDWVFTTYDDQDIERFIERNYGPNTLRVYLKLDATYGAARADFFRYLCLFRLGGMYLDIKSTIVQPINSWLLRSDRFILSQWDNSELGGYPGWGLHSSLSHVEGGEFQQWFVISSAGHPFLRSVIHKVFNNIMDCGLRPPRFGRSGVISITGPIAYTLGILAVMPHAHFRIVRIEQDCGVHYSCFAVKSAHITLDDQHYSRQFRSVVRLSGWRSLLYPLARRLIRFSG